LLGADARYWIYHVSLGHHVSRTITIQRGVLEIGAAAAYNCSAMRWKCQRRRIQPPGREEEDEHRPRVNSRGKEGLPDPCSDQCCNRSMRDNKNEVLQTPGRAPPCQGEKQAVRKQPPFVSGCPRAGLQGVCPASSKLVICPRSTDKPVQKRKTRDGT